MKRRRSNGMLLLIFSFTLVVMSILIANVFVVAVEKKHLRSNTDLQKYADSANIRNEVLKSTRGYIYDKNGVETGTWTVSGTSLMNLVKLTKAEKVVSGTTAGETGTTTNPGTGANDVVGVAAALAVVALVSGAAISLKK